MGDFALMRLFRVLARFRTSLKRVFRLRTFKTGRVIEAQAVLQERDHRADSTWSVTAEAVVDGELVHCVFKAVESHRLANELAAWWLARQVGMQLVVQAMLLDDADSLVGSVAGPRYPSAKFRRGLGTRFHDAAVFTKPDYEGLLDLATHPEVHKIIVFDVLIANTDRVDKNLLRADSFVVFDHDKAFTGQAWTACSLREAAAVTPNSHFEQYLQFAGPNAIAAILKVAADWQKRLVWLDVAELDELVTLDILTPDDAEALKEFILKRAGSLKTMVQGVIDRNRE